MAFPDPADYNRIWLLLWNVIHGHTFQRPPFSLCAPHTHICLCMYSLSIMLWFSCFHTSCPNSLNPLRSLCPPPLLCACSRALLCPQKGSLTFKNDSQSPWCYRSSVHIFSGSSNISILDTVLHYFIRCFSCNSLNNFMR